MEPRSRRRAPSPKRPSAASLTAQLVVLVACLTALVGATGCADWKPIRQLGVPGPALDKQLEGHGLRYGEPGGGLVETKVLSAQTPYVQIPGPQGAPRNPVTGERARDVLDLRRVYNPMVKIPDRPATIFLIAAGGAVGAGLVAFLVYGLTSGLNRVGNAHINYTNYP